MDIGKILIFTGVLFFVVGLILTFLSSFGLPKLPGDIYIKRDNFTFYFPWVTTLLISIILSIIINLFIRK